MKTTAIISLLVLYHVQICHCSLIDSFNGFFEVNNPITTGEGTSGSQTNTGTSGFPPPNNDFPPSDPGFPPITGSTADTGFPPVIGEPANPLPTKPDSSNVNSPADTGLPTTSGSAITNEQPTVIGQLPPSERDMFVDQSPPNNADSNPNPAGTGLQADPFPGDIFGGLPAQPSNPASVDLGGGGLVDPWTSGDPAFGGLPTDQGTTVDVWASGDPGFGSLPAQQGNPIPVDVGSFPTDTGSQSSVDASNLPVPPADVGVEVLPPFDVNPVVSPADPLAGPDTSNVDPQQLDFQFLPDIPRGGNFVNLVTGNTETFEPSQGWIGNPGRPADIAVEGPGAVESAKVPAEVDPSTSNVVPTISGNIPPIDNVQGGTQSSETPFGSSDTNPSVGLDPFLVDPLAGFFDQNQQPDANSGSPTIGINNILSDRQQNNVPVDPINQGDVIPVGGGVSLAGNNPGIISLFDPNEISDPSQALGNGKAAVIPGIVPSVQDQSMTIKQPNETPKKKKVPMSWMQLYPAGRRPRRPIRTQARPAESSETVSTADKILADISLGSFGRNRDLELKLRRKRKQERRQRRLEKQRQRQQRQRQQRDRQRQQGGQPRRQANRRRQQSGQRQSRTASLIIPTGTSSRQIARMVVPRTGLPFKGKQGRRGKRSVPQTSLLGRRGKRSVHTCSGLQRSLGLCFHGPVPTERLPQADHLVTADTGNIRQNRNRQNKQRKNRNKNKQNIRNKGQSNAVVQEQTHIQPFDLLRPLRQNPNTALSIPGLGSLSSGPFVLNGGLGMPQQLGQMQGIDLSSLIGTAMNEASRIMGSQGNRFGLGHQVKPKAAKEKHVRINKNVKKERLNTQPIDAVVQPNYEGRQPITSDPMRSIQSDPLDLQGAIQPIDLGPTNYEGPQSGVKLLPIADPVIPRQSTDYKGGKPPLKQSEQLVQPGFVDISRPLGLSPPHLQQSDGAQADYKGRQKATGFPKQISQIDLVGPSSPILSEELQSIGVGPGDYTGRQTVSDLPVQKNPIKLSKQLETKPVGAIQTLDSAPANYEGRKPTVGKESGISPLDVSHNLSPIPTEQIGLVDEIGNDSRQRKRGKKRWRNRNNNPQRTKARRKPRVREAKQFKDVDLSNVHGQNQNKIIPSPGPEPAPGPEPEPGPGFLPLGNPTGTSQPEPPEVKHLSAKVDVERSQVMPRGQVGLRKGRRLKAARLAKVHENAGQPGQKRWQARTRNNRKAKARQREENRLRRVRQRQNQRRRGQARTAARNDKRFGRPAKRVRLARLPVDVNLSQGKGGKIGEPVVKPDVTETALPPNCEMIPGLGCIDWSLPATSK